MKKYPFVKQEGLKDCGVCCLLMIINYYKGYVPIEKLRSMTKTNKNGVNAYNLIETANKLGFNAKGLKVDNLDVNINLPAIAFVTIDKSYNHYIVIYEINKEKKEIIIADPASGIKKMNYETFNKIFNNIILEFKCIKKLPLYNKPLKFLKFSINIYKIYQKTFIKVIILSLFITILSIIGSFYLEYIINGINKNNKSLLSIISIIFIIIYILKNTIDYIRNKILLKITKKINLKLTNDIFSKIILLPYEYFKNRTTGEVLTRINDLNIVSQTIIKVIITIILDMSLSIISAFFLIKISYKLFIITCIILALYFLIIKIYKKESEKLLEKIKEEEANLNSYIIENINGFETIKGLSLEKNIIDNYKLRNYNLLNENYNYENKFIKEYFLKNIIDDLGIVLIVFIGSILVINKEVTLGNLITYNSLFLFYINPLKNIVKLYKDIKEAKISYNRINELVYEEKENTIYHNLLFKNIKIKNLSFSYDNIKEELKNINLEIKDKEKIMIIGKSGSGKSTLLKLIKKYYQVDDDKIFIDDVDINKISKKEVNHNITYVSQNEILFTDTLYNNLVLGRKIKLKRINKIIKKLYFDFMDNNGLNMLIEENGFNLSGGQKQRIVLARSLLNNFKILILDEALSEIDINLERKILKNILKIYKDKTIILVSHRYNNIDLFDKVVKIEKGNVNSLEKKGK
ncbi:MAG: peptidase domain-containing ABC transporter [Bacilli bacterium]|nr:peptidase domain-containing ABC transporter [Bacilli bacterium]